MLERPRSGGTLNNNRPVDAEGCQEPDDPSRSRETNTTSERPRPHQFLAQVVAHLEAVETQNACSLESATGLIWQALSSDNIIHVVGSGHSTLFVLETFYRAGGLAAVNPVWHPALLPLMGGRTSTFLERVHGFGTELMRSARLCRGDVVVVFSHSGVNPVSVEAAEAARSAGASVIAVLSLAHSESVPTRHSGGLRLADVADVVIDTGSPVGDASYGPRPEMPPVAALSTILGSYIWNALLVRLADRAAAMGVGLPVWTSANVPGGDERSEKVWARFVDRIHALS